MASFKVHLDGFDDIQRKLAMASSLAEQTLAEQVRGDTEDYVPALNKVLTNSTQVVGNTIVYGGKDAPYARYLYNGKVMVWDGPPKKIMSKDGKMAISYKGQTKHTIEKPLEIQQSVHPYAQDHWFEASKANNLEKWLRVADKAVKDELK